MKKIFILLTSMAVAGTYAQAAGSLATGASTNNNMGVTTSQGAMTTGSTNSTNSARNNRNNSNRNNASASSNNQAAAASSNNNNNGAISDRVFLRRAAADAQYEIELGSMAQTNSTDSGVQALGAQLVADHTAALAQIQQIADLLGFTLPTNGISGDTRKALNRMANRTGTQFDMAFVRASQQSHLRDIQMYETAAARARNVEVRDFARAQLPILVDHYVATLDVRDAVLGIDTSSSAASGG